MSAGLAGLFVGLLSLARVAFLLQAQARGLAFDREWLTVLDSPDKPLFYLPASMIIFLSNEMHKRSRLPNWLLGGAIGFTVYVFLYLLADVGAEVSFLAFLALPFFVTSQFGDLLWQPLGEYIMGRFGSYRMYIQILGISWLSAIPFAVLGMLFAGAGKNQWLRVSAILLAVLFIGFCLFVLWIMLLLSFL
jgi:hypothetical protein